VSRTLVALCLAIPGCHLTAAQATLLEQGVDAACEALLPLATSRLPAGLAATVGPLDVWACRGAEAALAAALAPVVATPPATTPASGSASWGPGSARPLCAVREASGKMLGLVPTTVALRDGYVCGAAR
jgi:hypothetical protein